MSDVARAQAKQEMLEDELYGESERENSEEVGG